MPCCKQPLKSLHYLASPPASPLISSSPNYAQKLQNWSDSLLYSKCKIYGGNARVWLRKFAGLLPEVNRRQLYKRRGYASLYEFARKLAGMSDYTVDKILNVAAKLEDKPVLKEQFILGNEGWSKIEKVAYIATKETDDFWAKKVENLTQQALEVYVQEFRKKAVVTAQNFPRPGQLGQESLIRQDLTPVFFGAPVTLKSDGNNSNYFKQDAWMAGYGAANATSAENAASAANWANFSSPESPFSRLSFPVPYELEHELRLFKQKLEHERGQTLAWSEVMHELLKGYQQKERARADVRQKESVAKDISGMAPGGGADELRKIEGHMAMANSESGVLQCGQETRHIPAAVKKIIDEKYQHWCAFPGCRRPPNIYHHTRRFSLEKKHDPDSIVPLCKSHERLVHSGLINDGDKPSEWKILAEPDPQSKKFQVDRMAYGYYRKMQSG